MAEQLGGADPRHANVPLHRQLLKPGLLVRFGQTPATGLRWHDTGDVVSGDITFRLLRAPLAGLDVLPLKRRVAEHAAEETIFKIQVLTPRVAAIHRREALALATLAAREEPLPLV